MSTVSELNKPFFQTIQTVRSLLRGRRKHNLDSLNPPGPELRTLIPIAFRRQSFKDVSTTPGVETVGFANAAEGLVSIFGETTPLIRFRWSYRAMLIQLPCVCKR